VFVDYSVMNRLIMYRLIMYRLIMYRLIMYRLIMYKLIMYHPTIILDHEGFHLDPYGGVLHDRWCMI
jgi:hypothetical protein